MARTFDTLGKGLALTPTAAIIAIQQKGRLELALDFGATILIIATLPEDLVTVPILVLVYVLEICYGIIALDDILDDE